VLGVLDDRARTIVSERVFRLGVSAPTLHELGERFDLSRERVRQIESSALKQVAGLSAANETIARLRDQVRARLGGVFTAIDLGGVIGVDVDPANVSIEVKLILFLAGPYRRQGDTFVKVGFDDELLRLVSPVASGPVPLADVRASMTRLGILHDQQLRVLVGLTGIRILGDQVVSWSGSISDKAAAVLSAHQRLMTADEIHTVLGEGSLTALKNRLGSDKRFMRRGPRTWGLSEWGGEKYQSIAVEMRDELAGLPRGMPIERLKRQLGAKFDIGAASVEIMTVTHPMFVREGSWVRLRGIDEPYQPDTALEETRTCVVIDGRWSWRHLVTQDTLRGSGHAIPEPFAAHLGIFPATRRDFASDAGTISVYWPAQDPGIGSLRRAADRLSAEKGDYLFVVPIGDRIEFKIMRQRDHAHADPVGQLLARLGQFDTRDPWLPACARALGLAAHALPDEIDELLAVRGDRDVLRFFRSAVRLLERP
jgi:hypothetical protein